MASNAPITPGMGVRSTGSAPSGCVPEGYSGATPPGSNGGTAPTPAPAPTGMGLSFIVFVGSWFERSQGKQTLQGLKHGLVKIAVEGIVAQELHRKRRRADEWPKNPRKLAAEKQVAREPRKQHPPAHLF